MAKVKQIFDVIIVGSGPTGVHTAYPLVEAGLKVAIVDAEGTNQDLKTKSNIKINQSFEKGGLSNVWPGICDYFSDQELKTIGLPVNEIKNEYRVVAKRIKLQKKPGLDFQMKSLLNNDAYQLSVAPYYKTAQVVDQFKKYKNFTYIPGTLVNKINEGTSDIKINGGLNSKYIILAAGAINTTRILLQSFNLKNVKVPFLTKGYNLIVCLDLKSLSQRRSHLINPLGQVAMSNKNFFIQFYRFNPTSLHKVSIPLPKQITSLLFSGLGPYLVIADVRFSTVEDKTRFYQLRKNVLDIEFKYTGQELMRQKQTLRQIKKNLTSLGLLPLKTISGEVTSHYGGGANIPGKLSVDISGNLHNSKRIYVADASTWRYLPGKPPTLTIMANASRIGKNVLKKFKI